MKKYVLHCRWNGWKWIDVHEMDGNGWYFLKMDRNGWKWISVDEMDWYGCKWIKVDEMDDKLMYMDRNWQKWMMVVNEMLMK